MVLPLPLSAVMLPPDERLPRLEAVLEEEARSIRAARMRVGVASMLVGGTLVPLGVWSARFGDDDRERLLGTTIAIGGASVALIGLGTALMPSAIEKIHSDVVRRRQANESPAPIVAEAERRWRELAREEDSFRALSWVTVGGGVLLMNLGTYMTLRFNNAGGALFAALGGVYVLLGSYVTARPGHYRRGLRIYERALGVAVAPVRGGAMAGISVTF